DYYCGSYRSGDTLLF
nr:immunoglobulin light chain junction region [Macaca mulatta]